MILWKNSSGVLGFLVFLDLQEFKHSTTHFSTKDLKLDTKEHSGLHREVDWEEVPTLQKFTVGFRCY